MLQFADSWESMQKHSRAEHSVSTQSYGYVLYGIVVLQFIRSGALWFKVIDLDYMSSSLYFQMQALARAPNWATIRSNTSIRNIWTSEILKLTIENKKRHVHVQYREQYTKNFPIKIYGISMVAIKCIAPI